MSSSQDRKKKDKKGKKKKDKDIKEKDKERDKDRDKDKDKDKAKIKEKEKEKEKEKDKDKDKEKGKEKKRTAEEELLLMRKTKFELLPFEQHILKDDKKSRSRDRRKKNKNDKKKKKHRGSKSRSNDKRRKSSSKFRFDSPAKTSQERDRMDQMKQITLSSAWGDSVDPIKNPIAALEALQNMNPLIMMQKMQLMRAQSDVKADRKLYVGNLPPATQQSELQDFLNQGLLKMGVNIDVKQLFIYLASNCLFIYLQPGPCIVSTWINTDGHFGFVEFRNPDEATQGFCLNNVVYNGQALKIGRPKSFLTQLQQANQQSQLDNPISVLGTLKVENIDISNFIPLQLKSRTIQVPTRIIMLKHILTLEDLTIDEEYVDIMEDVKDECERYGKVQSITIPRPSEVLDPKDIKGLGRIIVEMRNVNEAKLVRKNIAGRLYMDRTVEVTYLNEDRFKIGDFVEIQ